MEELTATLKTANDVLEKAEEEEAAAKEALGLNEYDDTRIGDVDAAEKKVKAAKKEVEETKTALAKVATVATDADAEKAAPKAKDVRTWECTCTTGDDGPDCTCTKTDGGSAS